MKRIKETRRIRFGRMYSDLDKIESRVREIDDDAPIPQGAQEVPAETPLSDWQEEN